MGGFTWTPHLCVVHTVYTLPHNCAFSNPSFHTQIWTSWLLHLFLNPPPQERHASKVYAVKVCNPTKGKNTYNLILQVECIVDISQPYYSQMQKIRNEENANVQVSATQPTVRHFQNIVIPCTVQHIHSMFMRRSRYIWQITFLAIPNSKHLKYICHKTSLQVLQ